MSKHDRSKQEKVQRNATYASRYRQRVCKNCGHRTSVKGRCKICGANEWKIKYE